MKTNLANQILTALIATLILVSNSNASDCRLNPDAIKNGQDLGKFLSEQTTGLVKDSQLLKVGTRLKLNADVSENSEIKKLANEGVLSNKQLSSFKNFRNQNLTYGSMVAVSPCHSITNLHVIEALNADLSCDRFKGNGKEFLSCVSSLMNQNINLNGKEFKGSFPKACGEKSEVTNYQVVAHNQSNKRINKQSGKVYIPVENDFAILRSGNSLNSGRLFAPLSEDSPTKNYNVLSVSDGKNDLDDDNMKYLRLTIASVKKSTLEAGLLEGVSSAPGKSGSGVYSIEGGQVMLIGFILNASNSYVSWYSIAQFLRDSNQHQLLDEIVEANRTGVCK